MDIKYDVPDAEVYISSTFTRNVTKRPKFDAVQRLIAAGIAKSEGQAVQILLYACGCFVLLMCIFFWRTFHASRPPIPRDPFLGYPPPGADLQRVP